MIEEQARGDAAQGRGGSGSRSSPSSATTCRRYRPGSPQAQRLKEALIAQGVWSQYLEVGIGPDAEIFTKAQPMSAVGTGAEVGIHPKSAWNNPEPEIVLAVNSARPRRRRGARQRREPARLRRAQRAAARQGEGQQRLVRHRPVHPAVRRAVRHWTTSGGAMSRCTSTGPDGFAFTARSSMSKISRDPLELVEQAIGPTPSVSRRHDAVSRHDVRADDRPVRARAGLHPRGRRHRHRRRHRRSARSSTASTTPIEIAPWTFGARGAHEQSVPQPRSSL